MNMPVNMAVSTSPRIAGIRLQAAFSESSVSGLLCWIHFLILSIVLFPAVAPRIALVPVHKIVKVMMSDSP